MPTHSRSLGWGEEGGTAVLREQRATPRPLVLEVLELMGTVAIGVMIEHLSS